MSTLTKVLIGLGCVVVLCMLYLWFYGVQTLVAFEARGLSRSQPVVNCLLVELKDLSAPSRSATKLSALGYELDLPWNHENVGIKENNRIGISFDNAHSLLLTSEPPNPLLDAMIAQQQTTRENLTPVYGREAVRSDYDFKKAILSATPDKVSWRNSKAEAFRVGIRLAMKPSVAPLFSRKEFFLLKSQEFKGFRYGAPEDQLYDIEVELYLPDIRLEIHFNRDTGSAAPITQAEINRVVQSLREIPEESPSEEDRRP